MIRVAISTGAAIPDPVFGSFNNATSSFHWDQSAFTKPTFSATLIFGPDLTIFGNTKTRQDELGITCHLDFLQAQQEANSAPTSADKLNSLKFFGKTSGFGTWEQVTSTSDFDNGTSSAFGQRGNARIAVNSGTSLTKFQPFIGSDTFEEPINVNYRYNSITAMKEYEGKSLDELRMEDYLANRKGSQDRAEVSFEHPVLFGQSAAETTKYNELAGSPTRTFWQTATKDNGISASQPFEAQPFGLIKPTRFRAPFQHIKPLGAESAFGQTAVPSFGQTLGNGTAPSFSFSITANRQKHLVKQQRLKGIRHLVLVNHLLAILGSMLPLA